MDSEGIMLSEVNQTKKDKCQYNSAKQQNRNKLIDTENKSMVVRWRGTGRMGEKGKGKRD